MKPVRVLRIINRFNLGGITYNVSYLSRFIDGRFVTELVGGPEEKGEASSLHIPTGLGLKPKVILEMRRSPNILQDYLAYRKIRKIIREFRPDIVHTHASKAGAVGRLAAAHCGVPVIVHTFHGHVFSGYFGRLKSELVKAIERFLARKTDAIIAISPIQKEELSKKYKICDPGKIHVVPLGFDLQKFTENKEEKRQKFRSNYGIHENELALGIIGRLVPIKNHLLFVEAVAACKRTCSAPVRAVIVGDGETKEEIRAAIRHHGCTYSEVPGAKADFIFTGWIKEIDEVLPGLDIVCLTSKNEGTPVSLIEAQAAGKYIVSTNVGGISDIMHEGSGLLSPAGDKNSYMANLANAVENFARHSSGSGRTSQEIISRFSYKRLCSDMERLYDSLLGQKTRH